MGTLLAALLPDDALYRVVAEPADEELSLTLQMAAECRELARGMTNAYTRASLLQMALDYEASAERIGAAV
jgi:hypothetical protein